MTLEPDKLNVGSVDVIDDLSVAPEVQNATPEQKKAFVGRSPGQLAWMRLKRDRTGMFSMYGLIATVVLAVGAPLVQLVYGGAPGQGDFEALDLSGLPLGLAGGISGEHWFGVTPQNGRDVLLELIFGIRTSLGIATVTALLAVTFGVVIGIVAGYSRGVVDRVLSWFMDVMLAFPFFLFALALIPTLLLQLDDSFGRVAVWKKIAVIIAIFTLFNWIYTARIVRGQVISLREREYVEAARAAGAGVGHILFKQLLPNIWAPILVTFSLLVPSIVTAEAALAIFGIGIREGDGIADLGQLVAESVRWINHSDIAPGATWLPGLTVFLIVLAFNLFGDSLRDALDPKSQR
jgi:peptide/nickel transport system permease protein